VSDPLTRSTLLTTLLPRNCDRIVSDACQANLVIPAQERVKEMAFRGDCGVAACYIAELGRMASETPPRKGLGSGLCPLRPPGEWRALPSSALVQAMRAGWRRNL